MSGSPGLMAGMQRELSRKLTLLSEWSDLIQSGKAMTLDQIACLSATTDSNFCTFLCVTEEIMDSVMSLKGNKDSKPRHVCHQVL